MGGVISTSREWGLATAVGVAGVAGAGGWIAGAAVAGPAYPFVATAIFGVVALAAWPGLRAGHPHRRLGPANYVTLVRAGGMALVAAFLAAPVSPRVAWAAGGVAVVTAALDVVDGWIARRTRLASRFGARFDMETDALLILALTALAWRQDKAGVWVLAGGLMRYAFVAGGRVWPWLAGPLSPTLRGRFIAAGFTLASIVVLT
ncbi:MAG: CDP-alcohol phosphatidyltransferase family protein, partial [Vicinamibacteria bacterium]